MWGFIELSAVGIIVLGGVIALILNSIQQVKNKIKNPFVMFIIGCIIAYLMDDFSNIFTSGDVIVIALMIVTIIIMVIPMLKDWFKSRREKIEKIQEDIHNIDIKISKIEGQIESILHLTSKKKR